MRRTRLGFTLMELMIVIGIILLLVAMTIPVIGMIRKQAKEALCRNNLKQIGIGITAFQADNNNYFPSTFLKMFDPSQSLANENPRILICPFDGKTPKGTDPDMGRPASWGPLTELFQTGCSYLFEAANVPLGATAKTWDFDGPTPKKPWYDPAANRTTWAEAKAYQLKHGNTAEKPFRMSDFPIVRCFWHASWPTVYGSAKEKRVLNLAWDMSLYWSIPAWEDQVKAP